MNPKPLINFAKVSVFLTKSKYVIRQTHTPKRYEQAVNELLTMVQKWAEKWKV